jgi:hypothetical protein
MASMASVKGILRLECLGFGNEIGIPRLLVPAFLLDW